MTRNTRLLRFSFVAITACAILVAVNVWPKAGEWLVLILCVLMLPGAVVIVVANRKQARKTKKADFIGYIFLMVLLGSIGAYFWNEYRQYRRERDILESQADSLRKDLRK